MSVGNLDLRENLFVYFNIVCSQSKSKSSLLLLLLLSKEPIARKSFDSPRLKLTKLDDFQQPSTCNSTRSSLTTATGNYEVEVGLADDQ